MLDLEEVKELVGYKLKDYKNDASLFLRLDKVYRSLSRSSLCCLEQVESAILKLTNYITKVENLNKPKTMPNLFVLKSDSLLYSEKLHKYYTPDTITDEDALTLLASNKVYARYFEVLPEGWENMVDQYASQEPKKRKRTTKVSQEVPQVLEEIPAEEVVAMEVEETATEEVTPEPKTTTSTKKKKKK